tara:strand:- start:2305 stop:3645 length:1341 start_codon:yes stop_codon:yes gene_type:complete
MWDRYSVKDATESEKNDAAEESGITNGNGDGGGESSGVSEGVMTKKQMKKRDEIADSMSTREFNKRYGKEEGKNVKYATATKLAMKQESNEIVEKNKSGDSSLHDWFSKSKSSDGKPGWVQLGGKYAGKPCAKQPGQTTKPKCGSSKMKRNLNKKEEDAAFRRKNKQDPNPDRKGKAINVKTESTIIEKEIRDKTGNDKFDRYKRMIRHKQDKYGVSTFKQRVMTGADHNIDNEKKMKKEATYPSDFKKGSPVATKKKGRPNAQGPENGKKELDEGKKDACYHKVKSRYSVWPSAYASGALVKCRKKGAANWGNKSKKEEFEGNKTFQEFQEAGKKCWKGYEKKGTQTLFGKTYNRCVKKEENEIEEGAAWTKKSGQNKEGGLNEKGRKSYERENPGSDLKAPSKKVGNPRRASFCARMKGMRKRQKPSNNTGEDRLSKSLRAWNC